MSEGRKVLYCPSCFNDPRVLILILVISAQFFGDGIRDILDPSFVEAIQSPLPFTRWSKMNRSPNQHIQRVKASEAEP